MRYPNSTISLTLEVESGGRLSRSGTVVAAALKGTDQTHHCRGGLAGPPLTPASCLLRAPLTSYSCFLLCARRATQEYVHLVQYQQV